MYGKEYMGCLRSTFVISKDGNVMLSMYGVSAKGHVDNLIVQLEVE